MWSEVRTTTHHPLAISLTYEGYLGHMNAWKMGILHRDISEGNVLLVDEELASCFPFSAFLHDFDYSWFASQLQDNGSTSTCPATSGDKTPNLDDRVLLVQTVSFRHSSSTYATLS